MFAFSVAVIGWTLPGVVAIFAGDDSEAYTRVSDVLDEGVVAVLAAGLLFVLPVNWARRGSPSPGTRPPDRLGDDPAVRFGDRARRADVQDRPGQGDRQGLSDATNVSNEFTITVLVVVIAVLISETTSNTASAAIVVPIAIALAVANGVNPTVPGLAAVFAANFGFMLPVSTPPNAIVYSSGYLPINKMVKSGAVFDVIGAVLCIVGVALAARAVGLTS